MDAPNSRYAEKYLSDNSILILILSIQKVTLKESIFFSILYSLLLTLVMLNNVMFRLEKYILIS